MIDIVNGLRRIAEEGYRFAGDAADEIERLRASLEAAEKDVTLKERVIDALGSELNAVANERDALRAKIEAMERQKPAGKFIQHPSNGLWEQDGYGDNPDARPLYALPGARSQPAPSVREGWKLVPIEPTEDMLRAMTDPFIAINGDNRKAFESAYTAMLAAAPEATP